MKTFLAFGCDRYYPSGGWHDLIGDFDTLAEAIAACAAFDPGTGFGEAHVINTRDMSMPHKREFEPE